MGLQQPQITYNRNYSLEINKDTNFEDIKNHFKPIVIQRTQVKTVKKQHQNSQGSLGKLDTIVSNQMQLDAKTSEPKHVRRNLS